MLFEVKHLNVWFFNSIARMQIFSAANKQEVRYFQAFYRARCERTSNITVRQNAVCIFVCIWGHELEQN